jgi:hypothetical protein
MRCRYVPSGAERPLVDLHVRDRPPTRKRSVMRPVGLKRREGGRD